MLGKLQTVMKEVERLSDALGIDKEEFGQRAMRTSILSTSYQGTQEALDKSKIQWRRGLSLKAGIAVAEVFETLPDQAGGVLPLDEFMEKTTTAYMRITGMPVTDRYSRYAEVRGIVALKLQRSKELGQIATLDKEGRKFVKIYPEVGSTTFAMLMDPETMLRSPYVKAMAQTIGGMAIVDGDPGKITKPELSSTVQDRLHSHDLLQVTKTSAIFGAQNVDPFHQRNKVPFYSEKDDKLFILPTFPASGAQASISNLPALVSRELAFQLVANYGTLDELVNGFDPPFITLRSGKMEFYFNREHHYIQELGSLLGTSLSKYLPGNDVVFSALDELQSRLGAGLWDGAKVAGVLDFLIRNEVKESDLTDPIAKRIVSLLFVRLGYLARSPEGTYKVRDQAAGSTLKKLKALCDVTNPVGNVVSRMATREGD